MAQLTVPAVPELVGAAEGSVVTPLRVPASRTGLHDSLSTAPPAAPPARRRSVEPLVHLLVGLVALVVLASPWSAGAHVHPAVGLGVVALWPLLLAAVGCYSERPPLERASAHLERVLRAAAVLGLGCWLAAVVVGPAAAPSSLLPLAVVTTAASLAVAGAGRHLRRRPARVVVVGSPSDVAAATEELSRSPRPLHVAAACLTRSADGTTGVRWDALPVYLRVGLEGAGRVAAERQADVLLVVPGPELTPAHVRRLQWEAAAAGVHLLVGTALLDVAPGRTEALRAGGLGVVHVQPPVLHGPRRVAKELVERLAAATALVLLLPVMLLIGIAVRLDSRGPAIFRQQRVGRHGSHFTMYKFRTMRPAAEHDVVHLADRNEADGCLFKIRQDPRITRIGQVLRRYSLDELPQLWNVVTGQMALVGPRPALPDEVACYGVDPRRRLAVKPGLTGLWQVSGRSDLSWDETVRLDVRYVDNWSLRLDLWILCRTFRAVVDHQGAY